MLENASQTLCSDKTKIDAWSHKKIQAYKKEHRARENLVLPLDHQLAEIYAMHKE